MGIVYGFDANIIITLERYMPSDVHPGVWEQLEDLIADGRGKMPREVYEELTHADDGCAAWAAARAGFIEEPQDPAIIAVASEITCAHPGWVRERKNAADPWLVAHARVGGYSIVTNERRRGPGVTDPKLGIPNVADEHGVLCVTFNDLARAEGWQFHRA